MTPEEFKQALERLEVLEKELKIIKEHQHLGNDGSSEFLGLTNFVGKSVRLSGGVSGPNKLLAPFNIVDSTLSDATGKDESSRAVLAGILVNNKYTATEQDMALFGISKQNDASADVASGYEDWDKYSECRIRVVNEPQGSYYISGPSFFGPLGTVIGERTPVVSSTCTLSANGSVLVDSTAKFGVNKLVGGIVNISDTNGNLLESYKILSNTDNTITCGKYLSNGTFTLASFQSETGTYQYFVVMPVLLGISTVPFDRIYAGQDIRLGYGSSGGSQTRYIKWGEGSPEGVVVANVGSLYLRFDGGTGSTLYIKEINNGSATGWVAK